MSMQLSFIFLYIIAFLFGIVIGSFLNVCIYRLPLHENIAITGSHCMSCGHRLAWFDLVPLFSWMLLGGKCRYCKVKLSVQYPLIEGLNGIGYVLIFMVNGSCVDSIVLCLFFSALLVVSVLDWRTYEIPIGVNITILVLGITRTSVDYIHIAEHLIGLICVSLFLLLLNLLTNGRTMGGGDVKLMAAAGLLLGWKQIVLALWLGCIIGSVIHLCLMKFAGRGRKLALGPYLSIGMIIAMLWGDALIQWYMGVGSRIL